jgi:endonuclease/exonuclease/phosphatase family metal-dependent hydrolase
MRITAPHSPQRIRTTGAVQALALVAGGLVLGLGPTSGASASSARLDEQPAAATVFQLSSFNLLGADHTAPGGNKPDFASGTQRMVWATQILDEEGVDVVGFQEMEQPQYEKFMALRGSSFGIYPGAEFDNPAMSNSIAWRKASWSLVSATTVKIPYFDGKMLRKPLVLLRQVQTGQLAYFFNTHNPANARGPAQEWRDEAVRIQIELINRLRTESPSIPVLFTGDMNDREKFFCPITAGTELVAANGGTNVDGVCTPPEPTKIDWILGTREVAFTRYEARDDAFVNETTDHPVILATASIPPLAMQKAAVTRVLVLDVEGLSSRTLRRATATRAPNLYRMMGEGASTFNARTTVERTTLLPNSVAMLTGRRVTAAEGGHGVTSDIDRGGTVRSLAGRYVSSVYDVVHNFGRATALFSSKPRMGLVARSWDEANGGLDPYGEDDGSAKISRVVETTDDRQLVTRLNRTLRRSSKAFTLAHLSMLADSGREYGWGRARYFAALTEVDALIGTVLDTVEAKPALRDNTLVLVTAASGGVGTDPSDATRPNNYTVPFVAWGADVVAGADLYAINPAYTDPGSAQPAYTDALPIRNGIVANLATAALGLPALPGSLLNANQQFNIFVGEDPATPVE